MTRIILEVLSRPVDIAQIVGTLIAGATSVMAALIGGFFMLRARNKPEGPTVPEAWVETRTAKQEADTERNKRRNIEEEVDELKGEFRKYRDARDGEVTLLHRGLQILWGHFERIKDAWEEITPVPFPQLSLEDHRVLMLALEQRRDPVSVMQEEPMGD